MKTLLDAVEYAARYHDGHLTIMRFTTNWRMSFGPQYPGKDIDEWYYLAREMPRGETLEEAITAAMNADEDRRRTEWERRIQEEARIKDALQNWKDHRPPNLCELRKTHETADASRLRRSPRSRRTFSRIAA